MHAETGKVPTLALEHEEKPRLKPLAETPFDTDDIEPVSVTKLYRVPFDRNRYSVPWRLSGQSLVVRANDNSVGIFVGPKQIPVRVQVQVRRVFTVESQWVELPRFGRQVRLLNSAEYVRFELDRRHVVEV